MNTFDLEKFHRLSRTLDFPGAIENLLREVQTGSLADKKRKLEEEIIKVTFAEIFAAWDQVFPGFPRCRFPRRTVTRELMKGRRDKYLRDIIIGCAPLVDRANRLIINLVAVYGGHAKRLARALPQFEVLASDIDPRLNAVFSFFSQTLENYRFLPENVYHPNLNRRPSFVVFFGACGSLTDAGMQYAIEVDSPFLICRACCHDNTGGNTNLVKRWTPMSLVAYIKNIQFSYYARKTPGFYFCHDYDRTAYPKSKVAKALMSAETFMDIVRNCAESDICRFIVDLDRCLHLQEHGYHVMYREELFFAHKYGKGMGKGQAKNTPHSQEALP